MGHMIVINGLPRVLCRVFAKGNMGWGGVVVGGLARSYSLLLPTRRWASTGYPPTNLDF